MFLPLLLTDVHVAEATNGRLDRPEEILPQGSFIFESGHLYEVTLPDKKKYKLFDYDQLNGIQSLTRGGDRHVIFSKYHEMDTGVGHSNGRWLLKRIDLSSGNISTLVRGKRSFYVEKWGSIIFYRDKELHRYHLKDGRVTRLDYNRDELSLHRLLGRSTVLVPPLKLVFVTAEDQLALYDLKSESIRKLDIDGIRPIFWRDGTETLYGYDFVDGYYTKILLESGTTHQVDWDFSHDITSQPLYISKTDQMIYTSYPWYSFIYIITHGHPEPQFLYLYDFESRNSRMIGSGFDRYDDAVWFDSQVVSPSIRKSENLW